MGVNNYRVKDAAMKSLEWENPEEVKSIFWPNPSDEYLPIDFVETFPNLEKLIIIDSKLKELPRDFSKLLKLKYLKIENTQLVTVPEDFGNLKNLETIYLNNNCLKQIPESMGDLRNVRYLFLNNNEISELPPSLKKISENVGNGFICIDDNNLSYIDPILSTSEKGKANLLFPYDSNAFLIIDSCKVVVNGTQIHYSPGSSGKIIKIEDKKEVYNLVLKNLSKHRLTTEKINDAYRVFDFSDLISFAKNRSSEFLNPLIEAGCNDVANYLNSFYQNMKDKKFKENINE